MKKIFTFGIFLFLLIGIGNNVSATIIKSAGTGLQGSDWNSASTWVNGVVPTSTNTDSVQIVAGDSVIVNVAAQSSPTLVVNGVLNTTNYPLYVTGNTIVNIGGILSINKQIYCKNIYNYGKTWAPGKTNSSSTTTVALYVGYNCTGTTATASTDSCTILNDGIIGWYRMPAIASTPAKGCGMFVYYANTVKALNITHSPGVTSGYAFTVVQLAPISTSSSAQTQDLNLYINESLAFVPTSSGLPFGLLSSGTDAFSNKRTCTIAAGDTVFVAGYFHKNSAPTSVGPMVYNIYGCLDMASYRQSGNKFDIYTSVNPVTINIGDGTQANAGTLVLGAEVILNASTAGQIIFNPTQYSTVKFNYKTAPSIALTNITLSAYNLYVNSFGIPSSIGAISVAGNLTLAGGLANTVTLNGTSAQTITGGSQTITGLTVNNPSGATLASPLTVSGALTLTSGNLTLGSSNLTAGSVAGGSATSYVITNATGTLTQPAAATTATLFPIGTTTGYAPATITPDVAGAVSASVSDSPTGAFTGYSVNSNEWTLTPATATNATLALTPIVAANTNTPLAIFSGVVSGNYTTATPASLTGNNTTYSASGIALAAAATQYATGGSTVATAIDSNTKNGLSIYSANKSLVVRNATAGELVTVYGVTGSKVVASVLKGNETTLALAPGAYIVKVGSTTTKVLVQ